MPKNEFYFFNFTFHFAFDNGGIQLPYIFLYLRNETTIIKKHEELLKQWFTKVLRSRSLIVETQAFPGLSTGQKYISGQLGFKYFSSDHSIPEISPLAHFQLHISTSATLWILKDLPLPISPAAWHHADPELAEDKRDSREWSGSGPALPICLHSAWADGTS